MPGGGGCIGMGPGRPPGYPGWKGGMTRVREHNRKKRHEKGRNHFCCCSTEGQRSRVTTSSGGWPWCWRIATSFDYQSHALACDCS